MSTTEDVIEAIFQAADAFCDDRARRRLMSDAIDAAMSHAYAEGRADQASDEREMREEIAAKRRMQLEETARAMNETGQGEHGVTP